MIDIDPEDLPRQWVQWSETGMWAPVFADGRTGEEMTFAEMVTARKVAAEIEGIHPPSELEVPTIDVDPVSVLDTEVDW